METVKIGLSDGVKYLLTLLSIAIILLLFFCLDNQSKIIGIKRELLYMHTEKIASQNNPYSHIDNPVLRCKDYSDTSSCIWESCPLTK